jgi:hypothetical protein
VSLCKRCAVVRNAVPVAEDDSEPWGVRVRETVRVGDRLGTLTEEQRQRILWRLTNRNAALVDAVIDEFEATSWEYGR